MSQLLDPILGLSGTAAYIVVALLAFGEAAAFVGLVLPGEVAVLLGGVLAFDGKVSFPVMIAVVAVAAITGDSVGYEIGRKFGPRILAWPPFHKRFAAKVERTADYVQAKGGRAVFLGRWVGVLRALVPGMAGMARMPYGRFLAFNVIGGVAWSAVFVSLGYLAGSSWRSVERIAGRASLLLLALLLGVFLIRWATRRAASRADAVLGRLVAVRDSPTVRRLADPYSRQLRWLQSRMSPGSTRGLGLTLSVAVVSLGAWIVGFAVQDLFAQEELILLDRPVAGWIAGHTTAAAVSVAEAAVDGFSPPYGVWSLALAALVVFRIDSRAAAIRVVVASLTSAGIAVGLQQVLPLSPAGTAFPSVTVAWCTALIAASLPTLARHRFALAIQAAGVGGVLVLLASVADLVSGDASLSGVVGGFGIGLLIATAGELAHRVTSSPGDRGEAKDDVVPTVPVVGPRQ